MNNTIGILVRLSLPLEKAAETRESLRAFHKQSLDEPGLDYMHVVEDLDNPALVFISERWRSQQYFNSHIASSHFLELGKVLKGNSADISIVRVQAIE